MPPPPIGEGAGPGTGDGAGAGPGVGDGAGAGAGAETQSAKVLAQLLVEWQSPQSAPKVSQWPPGKLLWQPELEQLPLTSL